MKIQTNVDVRWFVRRTIDNHDVTRDKTYFVRIGCPWPLVDTRNCSRSSGDGTYRRSDTGWNHTWALEVTDCVSVNMD